MDRQTQAAPIHLQVTLHPLPDVIRCISQEFKPLARVILFNGCMESQVSFLLQVLHLSAVTVLHGHRMNVVPYLQIKLFHVLLYILSGLNLCYKLLVCHGSHPPFHF